jgi:hypothetical protein
LSFSEHDCNSPNRGELTSDDEGGVENTERTLRMVKKARVSFRRILSQSWPSSRAFNAPPFDIPQHNILVDDNRLDPKSFSGAWVWT